MLCLQALATHRGELPSREQKILLVRFYGGVTQDQIGQRLGATCCPRRAAACGRVIGRQSRLTPRLRG